MEQKTGERKEHTWEFIWQGILWDEKGQQE